MGLKAARCLRSFLPNLHAQGKQVACFASNHDGRKWEVLRSEGHDLNPCNSRLHPSVVEGGIEPRESTEIPVQEAYTPDSRCFGCGPSAQEGLKLRSFRIPGGLEATISLDPKYLAFPGIINGGVNFKEPTPAEQKLIVRSQVVRIKESSNVTLGKAAVQVELSLHLVNPFGREKLLVSGLGVFKRWELCVHYKLCRPGKLKWLCEIATLDPDIRGEGWAWMPELLVCLKILAFLSVIDSYYVGSGTDRNLVMTQKCSLLEAVCLM